MRRTALAAAASLLVLVAAACDEQGPATPPATSSPSLPTATPQPVALRVAVWGADAEVAAYRSVIAAYDQAQTSIEIEVESFASDDALMAALRKGDVPDVFLADREDLGYLLANRVTQPLGDRLDERAVDFGDDYSRTALESFSFDRDLQCMPYGVDPMVVYYNLDLVDFERMAARDLDVPDLDPERPLRWSLEQFRVAAEFATRPRLETRGFHVEPSLDGITPFLLSAGGDLYDDDRTPTSLSFSSDDSRSALEDVLPVLRSAPITLTSEQLAKSPALKYFEDGKLGMLVGNRSLTPALRAVEGLRFGVMPMPRVSSSVTTGDLTALCISRKTPEIAASADLLVHLISGDAVREVVSAGYLVPANQTVALTDDFVQPLLMPARADVFTDSLGDLFIEPVIDDPRALREAVDPAIRQLLTVGVPNLDQLTAAIDGASSSVLAPPTITTSESPSPD